MNKYVLRAILNRLIEIKNKVNIDKNKGICFNLSNYTYNRKKSKYTFICDYFWLEDQFNVWPECHADKGFNDLFHPVGGEDEYWEEKDQGIIWKNPKRHRLLDFLINQATAQLHELKD